MPASLKQLAMESGILNVSNAFFEHFVEHYQNTEFTMDDLKRDQKFQQCLLPDKPKKVAKKVAKKSTTKPSPKLSLEERHALAIMEDKCQCRIWNNLKLDSVQCTGALVDDTNFCSRHIKAMEKHPSPGGWWLGLIGEDRPEEPYGPPGVPKPGPHHWSDQAQPQKKSSKKTSKEVTISKDEVTATLSDSQIQTFKEMYEARQDNSIQENLVEQASLKYPSNTSTTTTTESVISDSISETVVPTESTSEELGNDTTNYDIDDDSGEDSDGECNLLSESDDDEE